MEAPEPADTAALEATSPSPARPAYLRALDLWDDGDVRAALATVREALAADPDHPPSRLLEAYCLLRTGHVGLGMEGLDAIVHDPAIEANAPEVARHAELVIRRYAGRWTRDDWSLGGGPVVHDQRSNAYATWAGGIAIEGYAPFGTRLGARVDATTPFYASDTLAIEGSQWSAMIVGWQPLGPGIWQVDAALGPSLWVGRSFYWDYRYRGAFPGARGTVAIDARLWEALGLRFEVGYTAHYGARPGLHTWSHGPDLRLIAVGYHR